MPWADEPGRTRAGLLLPPASCLGCSFQYGMVFDAGSSHTSLFVYEWDSDKQNNTGVVSQTLSCDVQGQYSLGKGLCGGWVDLASLFLACPCNTRPNTRWD